MPRKRSVNRGAVIRWVFLVLLLLFIISFPQETWHVILVTLLVAKSILTMEPFDLPQSMARSINVINYNCASFLLLFFGWLIIIGWRSILPVIGFDEAARHARRQNDLTPRLTGFVQSFIQRIRAIWHLFLYMFGLRGLMQIVRGGRNKDGSEVLPNPREFRGPGVLMVDHLSAVVLEERVPTPSTLRPLRNIYNLIAETFNLQNTYESPRIVGPGLHFTRRRERVRAAVDLRRQIFRTTPAISLYTREGIELTTSTWVLFTVGQTPDVVDVTYAGLPTEAVLDAPLRQMDRRAPALRVLRLEPVRSEGAQYLASNGSILNYSRVRVVEMTDDLSADDRTQIHKLARVGINLNATGALGAYAPTPPPDPVPAFEPRRIFNAVFSIPRDDQSETVPWQQLPPRVSADLLRAKMMTLNYNQIYQDAAVNGYPLLAYRRELAREMRNLGVLSYRLVFHIDGRALQVGQEYNLSELVISAPQPLTSPAVLRDRGIKVIAAGFGELTPVSPVVYRQRLENWASTWKRDTQIIVAEQELAAMRIQSHARAQAQSEIFQSFSELFESNRTSREALALRVYQALEEMVANPATRKLLNYETLAMMNNMHDWLLPKEKSTGGGTMRRRGGNGEDA